MKTFLQPVSPDSGHPSLCDPDGGDSFGGSTELQVRGVPFHSGLTAGERVMHGYGTPADLAACERNNQLHKQWLAGVVGQAWLRSQPWFKG